MQMLVDLKTHGMVFDSPYPSHSDSMERVIHDALSSPNHEDVDDILSTSPSIRKQSFKFSQFITAWLGSRPILKRLRSFKVQPRGISIASCSSLSLPSGTADDILGQLPESGSSIGKLVQSIQNMDKCFTPSAADDTDTATKTTCMSPYGSFPGGGSGQEILVPVRFLRGMRDSIAGARRYLNPRGRQKTMKFKERYLEVHDGIWDSVVGMFIPNAWPAPEFGVKAAISRSKVLGKLKTGQ